MNFHNSLTTLMIAIVSGFVMLSLLIAVWPAYKVQQNNPALPNAPAMTEAELRGRAIYIAEGCQACHTQQVRSNIIDQAWGERPSVPADYARNTRMGVFQNTASVLGSERTGSDLSNVGVRQPGDTWHYLHLYNPRSVVEHSIMPAYPWLFEEVDEVLTGQKEVFMSKGFGSKNGKHIITTSRAEDLVSYLKSLKQQALPEYMEVAFEAYDWQKTSTQTTAKSTSVEVKFNGKKLYAANCQVCHQPGGTGVANAFPPLKGSGIVNNPDPTQIISIVLFGFDRDNAYGAMQPFGEKLSDEEIAAIISFERAQWQNSAGEVSPQQVKEIRQRGMPKNWTR